MRVKKWLVVGVAAACALALVGGGAVLAQSADGEGDSFLDRVARKLGVEPQALEDAIRDTRNEDIDAAVESGRLTQEQADLLKERLEAFPDGDFAPFPLRRHGGIPFDERHFERFPGPGGPGFHFGFGLGLAEAADELSSFLGISTEQLREELSDEGSTLASIAEAHGKTREELKDFIAGNIEERLDQAVADGHLTQEMADDINEKLNEGLDALIDSPRFDGRGFRFDFHRQDGDGDPNEEGGAETPAAPQSGAASAPGQS